MKKKFLLLLTSFLLLVLLVMPSCQPSSASQGKSIVVTYAVLGSVVKDLVGDKATVTVSIPNGLDPHEFEPSAKDIEAINKADLIVENGLDLEAGMTKTIEAAVNSGVKVFIATDHIELRYVEDHEEIHEHDSDHVHAAGAADPHFWLDPLQMKSVVSALVPVLEENLGIDVSERAALLEQELDNLDGEISNLVAQIPAADRKLVTGHESMGYFARRYDFQMVGVIIPSLSSQAGVSAADMADLKEAIEENQVSAVFSELGTSSVVADTIARETGVKVVELITHALPEDGSYLTFMRDIATVIVDALK
jgi:zinc/manganese transport system substrate-binding protein